MVWMIAKVISTTLWISNMTNLTSRNVMVVSDKIEIRQALASALGLCGLAPIIAKTESEAIAILSHHSIALIFCSDELPGDPINALIRGARRFLNQVPVVVVSRLDDWERYLNCLRSG